MMCLRPLCGSVGNMMISVLALHTLQLHYYTLNSIHFAKHVIMRRSIASFV